MLKNKIDIFADTKQALTDLKEAINSRPISQYSKMGQIIHAEKRVIEKFEGLLAHKYVHFELPNNGARLIDLIDGKVTDDIVKNYILGSHLPFERVSFEFELAEDIANKSKLRAVVVLAHEEYIDGNVRAIILNIISQGKDKLMWGKSKYKAIANAQPAYIIIDENYTSNNQNDVWGIFQPDGKTRANSYAIDDSFTEAATIATHTVIAALAALSCSNVKIEKGFPPSVTDNNKRAKKGIVQYTQKNYITFSIESEVHGTNPNKGSNTKKATHIRRGHIRRYQSGKKIWVESTVVNGGVGQASPKKYKVK